ncbi:MAG: copper homeostasis membrane protein CopD [Candidatus Andeanibacterium colombiense]|uniref:Copper homeostasis membrane protein CopD n=1 Tax=Candidatus Andeanibacterium colombiense TaxID=3121345 RepID=A0AAJ6BQA9_9SPHN|nr:MAG: copper homeostasis membrane protein CopD [Sphingomonadaceae bacterium]
MIEPAIVAVRLVQYLGAAVLMGLPLFCVWVLHGALPKRLARRVRGLIAGAAAVLALASLLAVALQGSLFSGSLAGGFAPETYAAIVSSMSLGTAAVARAALAMLACVLALALPAGRANLIVAAILGTLATATLAWLGHAADGRSWMHLTADVLHALTAAVWFGALAGFVLLLSSAREQTGLARLQSALERFSALGIPLVLVLALTGLVNGWYLIGPRHIGELPSSPYGQLLLIKLAVFAAMLLLAAFNRWRLTPALAEARTLGWLRRSIALETALGLAVFALVAWLGTLEPLA